MKSILTSALTLSMLVLSGCAHHPADLSHHGEARFDAGLKSYAVITHPVDASPSARDAFNQRVHKTMARKGYVRAPRGQADLYVSYKTLLMDQGGDDGYAYADDDRSTVTNAMISNVTSQNVRKLVLVTIEDADTDQIKWVGWATGEMSRDRVTESATQSIDAILARIPARN